jgi:hypothetical protein
MRIKALLQSAWSVPSVGFPAGGCVLWSDGTDGRFARILARCCSKLQHPVAGCDTIPGLRHSVQRVYIQQQLAHCWQWHAGCFACLVRRAWRLQVGRAWDVSRWTAGSSCVALSFNHGNVPYSGDVPVTNKAVARVRVPVCHTPLDFQWVFCAPQAGHLHRLW